MERSSAPPGPVDGPEQQRTGVIRGLAPGPGVLPGLRAPCAGERLAIAVAPGKPVERGDRSRQSAFQSARSMFLRGARSVPGPGCRHSGRGFGESVVQGEGNAAWRPVVIAAVSGRSLRSRSGRPGRIRYGRPMMRSVVPPGRSVLAARRLVPVVVEEGLQRRCLAEMPALAQGPAKRRSTWSAWACVSILRRPSRSLGCSAIEQSLSKISSTALLSSDGLE